MKLYFTWPCLEIWLSFSCFNLIAFLPPIWTPNVKCGFHWFIFVFVLHALLSWLSSFVFCGYLGCITLCVLPTEDVRDWLRDIWISQWRSWFPWNSFLPIHYMFAAIHPYPSLYRTSRLSSSSVWLHDLLTMLHYGERLMEGWFPKWMKLMELWRWMRISTLFMEIGSEHLRKMLWKHPESVNRSRIPRTKVSLLNGFATTPPRAEMS